MANGVMNLEFPKLGVIRNASVRQEGRQAEYGTPWAFNVRLEDSITGRNRGGSFTVPMATTPSNTIRYRDRSLTFLNNAVSASRVGSYTDFTMSSDVSDTMRPAYFQFSEADKVALDVVALVPHKDQYLLCFSATETWVQQGDPLTGVRRRVSDEVGIVGRNAWCVAHDKVYFLSDIGLYSVNADGSELKAISEELVPAELQDSANGFILEYDHETRGVRIYSTTTPSWFYDTESGGIWPMDRTVSQSHVLLGPLRVGSEDEYGRILDLHGNIATGSGTVTWRIVPGDTAEIAAANGKAAIEAAVVSGSFSQYYTHSGTWVAGRSNRSYPRT